MKKYLNVAQMIKYLERQKMKHIPALILFLLIMIRPGLSLDIPYSSVPKGITLEGTADGIGLISRIKYRKSGNTFIINDHLELPNPIKAKEFAYMIGALENDSLFGISVIAGTKAIYYGSWSGENGGYSISKKLFAADEFFRGVVFAIPYLYKNYHLPERYKPQKPLVREYYTAVWFNLRHFRFRLENTRYKYVGCNIQVKLLAVENNDEVKAADGGYKYDPNGETHEEDRANVAHIKAHAKAYLSLPVTRPMIEYGQAAAIIRLLKSQNIDLEQLKTELQ